MGVHGSWLAVDSVLTAAGLRERPGEARAPRSLPCSYSPAERNTGCGTAGGVGAVRSSGGGDAGESFSIGGVDDSKAVKECAARLVDELKVDPSVASRFARARQGDFSRAQPFLQADLAWRALKTPVLNPEPRPLNPEP